MINDIHGRDAALALGLTIEEFTAQFRAGNQVAVKARGLAKILNFGQVDTGRAPLGQTAALVRVALKL